jgi:DnaJ-like protein
LSADLSKAYDLLGVKPGVSIRELKAAHRDLAKVWHPDRFQHDPRLQEKAQEKLKEINEAYELISSGKVPRPTPPPRAAQNANHTTNHHATERRGASWQWPVIALLVFAAVFAVTMRTLLKQRALRVVEETVQAEEPATEQPSRPDSNTRAEVKSAAPQTAASETTATPEITTPADATTAPVPAVETVTVLIDPETGLLAKPECRLRSRMTYPSGSQPTAYCTLSHAPPPKESKIKSIAKGVKRTLD